MLQIENACHLCYCQLLVLLENIGCKNYFLNFPIQNFEICTGGHHLIQIIFIIRLILHFLNLNLTFGAYYFF